MRCIKSYSELIKIPTFSGRLQYLLMDGVVGEFTFNGHRSLNQSLYKSLKWRVVRRSVIIRDEACDLGLEGYEILGSKGAYVHHINPISIDDILQERLCLFDMENLITVSRETHNMIHYGIFTDQDLEQKAQPIIRRPGDTCPWR